MNAHVVLITVKIRGFVIMTSQEHSRASVQKVISLQEAGSVFLVRLSVFVYFIHANIALSFRLIKKLLRAHSFL